MNLDDNTLTAMVEAAARGQYDRNVEANRSVYPEGVSFPEYDDLDPLQQTRIKEAVLMIVWDAIQAMPDPRYTAWEEGKVVGHDEACACEGYEVDRVDWDNPYPAPEVAL